MLETHRPGSGLIARWDHRVAGAGRMILPFARAEHVRKVNLERAQFRHVAGWGRSSVAKVRQRQQTIAAAT
jgi:hypothetical protein